MRIIGTDSATDLSFITVCPQQPEKGKTFVFFFFVVPHACREQDHVHACHTCTIHVTSISADRKQRSCISCSASCAFPVGLRSLHVAHRKLFSSWQRGRRGGWGGGGPSRTINRKLKGWAGRGSHKGIQDKGTFTRTMCTSTVIYRYSSPSSFQLSENKQKCQQLKDSTTQQV